MYDIMRKSKKGVVFFVILVTILAVSGIPVVAADTVFDPNHTSYNNVMRKTVKDGLVDYAGLKRDHEMLDSYLTGLSKVKQREFKSWDENKQLGYLINLYNATTLKLIIDNYPVKSIKDIGSFFKGPWKQPVVKLFGKSITLNTLEHKIIRVDYNEPRIHVALVCAAKGCPPLRNEAYTGEKLNSQLDDQVKVFLNNPVTFRIDQQNSTVYISPIFKWYGEDFIKKFTPKAGFGGLNKTEQAVLNFSSRYLSEVDKKYLAAGGYSVKYLDYDWSLNEQHPKTKR